MDEVISRSVKLFSSESLRPSHVERVFDRIFDDRQRLANAELLSKQDFATVLLAINPAEILTCQFQSGREFTVFVLDDYEEGRSGVAIMRHLGRTTYWKWSWCQHRFVDTGRGRETCSKCGRTRDKEAPNV